MQSDGRWHDWEGPFGNPPNFGFIEFKNGNTGNLEAFGLRLSDGVLFHNYQTADEQWHFVGTSF